MKRTLLSRISLSLLLATSYFGCFAQWSSNPAINTLVCNAANQQLDLRMSDDGAKGAFIVWKDYRNGVPDVYAQHVDSNGVCLWNANGVPVCTNSSDQSTPAVISDMNGGIIVSWSDWRSGIERDIYAQRLNANGQPMWTFDGVLVAGRTEREHNQRMVSDEMGGAIIIFELQNNSSFKWEIWGQRINQNGTKLWASAGVRMHSVPNVEFLNPRIQEDGKGGVVVTWQEFRNGLDYDVYAQRLSPTGSLRWGTNAVLVSNTPNTQNNPKIDPDVATGGFIIAWTDKRNNIDYDIYAQKLDSLGNLLWTSGGMPISTAPGNQSAVDIYNKPIVGGTIFTWKDNRNGNYDIYAQKVNANGVQQWTTSGVPVCNASNDQLNPNITGDGLGGAIICWQDMRTGTYDIMAQRVANNATMLWTSNGVAVGTASGNQGSPKNISDGNSGSIFAFEDSRNGSQDIYVHKIFYDGYNVGIDEQNHLGYFHVFPNPATDKVRINYLLLTEQEVRITLYNAEGKTILSEIRTTGNSNGIINELEISLESLNPGVYIIKAGSDKFQLVRKLIKQ